MNSAKSSHTLQRTWGALRDHPCVSRQVNDCEIAASDAFDPFRDCAIWTVLLYCVNANAVEHCHSAWAWLLAQFGVHHFCIQRSYSLRDLHLLSFDLLWSSVELQVPRLWSDPGRCVTRSLHSLRPLRPLCQQRAFAWEGAL